MRSVEKFAWTAEAIDEMRRRAEAGESAGQISSVLGCSRSAVIGKCRRAQIRLGVGRKAEGAPSLRANSLAGRIKTGRTGIVMPAPVEVAVEKAEAYLASSARRHAFDPAHAPSGARLVRLHELEPGECKWPLYEDGPQIFCGCAVRSFDQDGRPHAYCDAHRSMATAEAAR